MDSAEALDLIQAKESHTTEFKRSLSQSCQREGIESLVAFANRDGGRVIFGVDNDGNILGVDVGRSSIEDFVNRAARHIYPALPIYVETALIDGRSVLVAEAPADTPPVIGLYGYVSKSLDPHKPVDASLVTGFRRVGRTNQKVNLMWLRKEVVRDPLIRLVVTRTTMKSMAEMPKTLRGILWIEEGSATAHEIVITTEPPLYTSGWSIQDLPFPTSVPVQDAQRVPSLHQPRMYGWQNMNNIQLELSTEGQPVPFEALSIVATYRDDFGVVWQARRELGVLKITADGSLELSSLGFRRGIIEFPPQSLGSPA